MNKAQLTALIGQKVTYAEQYVWDRGGRASIVTLLAGPDSPEAANRLAWDRRQNRWLVEFASGHKEWVPANRFRGTEAVGLARNEQAEASQRAQAAADNRMRMLIDDLKDAGFKSAHNYGYGGGGLVSLSIEDCQEILRLTGNSVLR